MANQPLNQNVFPAGFRGVEHQYETLIYAVYYAPRGRARLYMVSSELAHRYLYPTDLIVGIIGAEGAGKSTLIKGLFPGLELTNDDDGINLPRAPIYDFAPENYFAPHTFHIDVRHEMAFHQPYEIVEAVNKAVSHGRRVVIEHFDRIYDALGYNAQILFGIGEEIIVARPNVFGPFPAAIHNVVAKTIKYRLMAHSAEDITGFILEHDYHYLFPVQHSPMQHSDVKHGFVISFHQKPDVDLDELEAKVKEIIQQDLPIQPAGENKIAVGNHVLSCTGTRTHVKRSSEIEDFRLVKELSYHPILRKYMLVGIVGPPEPSGYDDITKPL